MCRKTFEEELVKHTLKELHLEPTMSVWSGEEREREEETKKNWKAEREGRDKENDGFSLHGHDDVGTDRVANARMFCLR